MFRSKTNLAAVWLVALLIGPQGAHARQASIDVALAHHELIKVKINAADKSERQAIIDKISEQTAAGWVLSIGHIAGFYRPAEKPKIVLP